MLQMREFFTSIGRSNLAKIRRIKFEIDAQSAFFGYFPIPLRDLLFELAKLLTLHCSRCIVSVGYINMYIYKSWQVEVEQNGKTSIPWLPSVNKATDRKIGEVCAIKKFVKRTKGAKIYKREIGFLHLFSHVRISIEIHMCNPILTRGKASIIRCVQLYFLIEPDITTGPHEMFYAFWNAHPLGEASAL